MPDRKTKTFAGFELWREPDEKGREFAVWYGPAGPEGDVATTVAKAGPYEYRIGNVQDVRGLIDEPEENFLVTSYSIELDYVVETALRIGAEEARRRLDQMDEEKKMRLAVGIGVGLMEERGAGDEAWAPSLADGIAQVA